MTALLRPPPWTTDAACVGHPLGPQAWDHNTPEAQTVCTTCPTRLRCAAEALTNAIPEGTWGGWTPHDRRRIADTYGYDRPGSARHGNRSRYTAGCRCPDCREGHRRYIESRSNGRGHRPPADTTDRRISA